MQQAWTDEPFEHLSSTIRMTPPPATMPHPMLMLGGTSRAAVRRAARFGLPFFAAADVPGLREYYKEQCAVHETKGFFIAPTASTAMVHVAEDPDRAWQAIGHHLLHEAQTYAKWQTPDIASAVHSDAATVDELRADGKYVILTPAACVERCLAMGPFDALTLHPLCGGMPLEDAWSSIRLVGEVVIPEVAAREAAAQR